MRDYKLGVRYRITRFGWSHDGLLGGLTCQGVVPDVSFALQSCWATPAYERLDYWIDVLVPPLSL